MDSGPYREKVRPAGEIVLILGSLGGAGRTFSRVDTDGGEQGEFFRACGAWSVVQASVGGLSPEKSHVIRLGEVSIKSENVAIPTIVFQNLKGT